METIGNPDGVVTAPVSHLLKIQAGEGCNGWFVGWVWTVSDIERWVTCLMKCRDSGLLHFDKISHQISSKASLLNASKQK